MSFIVEKYGVEVDLSREGKVGCPRCISQGKDRSHNNLMVYGLDENGKHRGFFCWACEYTYPSQERLEEMGKYEDDIEENLVGSEFNDEVHKKLKEQTGTNPKGYRFIDEKISKPLGVRYGYDEETGEVVKTFYPVTVKGTISGYKVRNHPKSFEAIGTTGKDCDLFMQWKWLNTTGKYVVLTAGEHDALAAFQMLKEYSDSKGYDPIPVVSSTIGERGSYKQVQLQYDWFNGFNKIVVIYDNDDAGKEALDSLHKVLPKGKMFVAKLPLKDSNKMLEEGKSREFVNAFYSAQAYTPDGIVGSGELFNKIKELAVVPKIPLPPFMHKVQTMMAGGIPLGVILNLGSASGTGKSTIVDEILFYMIFHSPYKVGVVSLESDCAQYGTKILSRHLHKKIDLIEDPLEKLKYLESEYVTQKAGELFWDDEGGHRWMLVEDRDGGVDSLQNLVMKMIVESECRVILLDPLQDIIDALSGEEQAKFMKWQKGLVKSHGVTFINVNHVRKNSGGSKANSTGADIHEEDFHGNSAIFKSGACNLLFTRDKEAEDEVERNTTRMKMTKCRWTGRTSPYAGEYYYSNDEHMMYDKDDWLKENPHMRVTG